MITITYGVSKEIYEWEEKQRIAYGIVVYADIEKDGTATIIESIRDISSDRKAIEELVEKCNRLQLSLIHLGDVVDDFLTK